jgi:hypothetical protein
VLVEVALLGHDAAVPAEAADLVDAESGSLPEFRGGRDARKPQRVTPDVDPDALAQEAHDAQHAPGLERTVTMLPALSACLEERSGWVTRRRRCRFRASGALLWLEEAPDSATVSAQLPEKRGPEPSI